MNAKLNKRERRAAALLAHYATCERLAAAMGLTGKHADGKRLSVALWKLETDAHSGATACCNGEAFACYSVRFAFGHDETAWEQFQSYITNRIEAILGKVPPGFFVNGDARGYALKIDPDNAEGKALIEACQLHTDWGRNGILSPEITGD